MTSEHDEVPTDQNDGIEELVEAEAGYDTIDGDAEPADPGVADDATESLRELVTYLVNHLVDEPEQVEISVDRRGQSVQIQLRLPEGDLGKVIGRGGRIAKAIRTVLLIAGSKHHLRVSLDIES